MQETRAGRQFLLLLLAGSGILAFFIFLPFFAPLVFATVFAVVLQPLYKRVSKTLKRWPSTASFITVLIAALCILIPLGFLSVYLAQQAQQAYIAFVDGDGQAQVEHVLLSLEQKLGANIPGIEGLSEKFSADISTYSQQALQWVVEHTGSVFSSVVGLFLGLFIFFVALYYLLRDGPKFKQAIVELSPLPDGYDNMVFDRLGLAVNSVVRGSLLIGLIQGTITAIGFTIFGVPNSILWGTIAAVAALIPGVGTSIVLLPAIIFLFVTGGTTPAIGLAIWGVLAVGMIDNFLGPRLMGRGIHLHPLLVLLSVLGGVSFFGILGLFLGPVFLSFLFALLNIYAAYPKQPPAPDTL